MIDVSPLIQSVIVATALCVAVLLMWGRNQRPRSRAPSWPDDWN